MLLARDIVSQMPAVLLSHPQPRARGAQEVSQHTHV